MLGILLQTGLPAVTMKHNFTKKKNENNVFFSILYFFNTYIPLGGFFMSVTSVTSVGKVEGVGRYCRIVGRLLGCVHHTCFRSQHTRMSDRWLRDWRFESSCAGAPRASRRGRAGRGGRRAARGAATAAAAPSATRSPRGCAPTRYPTRGSRTSLLGVGFPW